MTGPDPDPAGADIEDRSTASFGPGAQPPAPEPPARRFLPGMRFADRRTWPRTWTNAPASATRSAWTSLLGMLILAAVAGAAFFVARGGASAWRRAGLGFPSGTGV